MKNWLRTCRRSLAGLLAFGVAGAAIPGICIPAAAQTGPDLSGLTKAVYGSYTIGATAEQDVSEGGLQMYAPNLTLTDSTKVEPGALPDNWDKNTEGLRYYNNADGSDGVIFRDSNYNGFPAALVTHYFRPKREAAAYFPDGNIYFQFDNTATITPADKSLTFELEYFDSAEGKGFGPTLSYVNTNGTVSHNQTLKLQGTDAWTTGTVTLNDCRFNDKTISNTTLLTTYFFRFSCLNHSDKTKRDFYIKKVAIYNTPEAKELYQAAASLAVDSQASESFPLPDSATGGAAVTWESSRPDVIAVQDGNAVVKPTTLPCIVTLTATVIKNQTYIQKSFAVTVPASAKGIEPVQVTKLELEADGKAVTQPTQASALTAKATVAGSTGEGKVQLLAALYKEDGQVMEAVATSEAVTVDGAQVLEATLNNVPELTGHKVRYYLWEMGSQKPYELPIPTQPQSIVLAGQGYPRRAVLQWNALAPAEGTTYAVYRNGAELKSGITNGGYIDEGVAAGTYTYQVKDSQGQESNIVTVTVVPIEDQYSWVKAEGTDAADLTTDQSNNMYIRGYNFNKDDLSANKGGDFLRPITDDDNTPQEVKDFVANAKAGASGYKYWANTYDGSVARKTVESQKDKITKDAWVMAAMVRKDRKTPMEGLPDGKTEIQCDKAIGCLYPRIQNHDATLSNSKEITLFVEYYDGDQEDSEQKDSFVVKYYPSGTRYNKDGQRQDFAVVTVTLGYTGEWKLAQINLRDALFNGSKSTLMVDCDFRLETDSLNGIYISQVWAAPLPEVPVTDDPRTAVEVRSADEDYENGISWSYASGADEAHGLHTYIEREFNPATPNYGDSYGVKVQPDGENPGYVKTMGNTPNRWNKAGALNGQTFVYFYMEPNDYLWGRSDSYVEMEVEYLDDAQGDMKGQTMYVEYENSTGAYNGKVYFEDSMQGAGRKTARVVLTDAFFQGRQNGPNNFLYGPNAMNGLNGNYEGGNWGARGCNFRIGINGQGKWNGEARPTTEEGDQLKIISVTLKNVSHRPVGQLTGDGTHTIYVAGDSIAAYYDGTDQKFPERRGWGMYLQEGLKSGTAVQNLAVPGSSVKTFGGWDTIYQNADADDYVLLCFGHNDSMTDGRGEDVPTYKGLLKDAIEKIRLKGATPILLTPIPIYYPSSQNYSADSVDSYRQAMGEVAKELAVPFVDVASAMRIQLATMSHEERQSWYDTKEDNWVHLVEKGAREVAQTILTGLKGLDGVGVLPGYIADLDIAP